MDAVTLTCNKFLCAAQIELYTVFHACLLGVIPRNVHRLGVDVSSHNVELTVLSDVVRFLKRKRKSVFVHAVPLLKCKGAVSAGGYFQRFYCRFYRQCAASAKQIAKHFVGIPHRKVNQGGGCCFLQGGGIRQSAIPSLVQTHAGGVQIDGYGVFCYVQFHLVFRTAFLNAAVLALKNGNDGFFAYRLNGMVGKKQAVHRFCYHGNFALCVNPISPGNGRHSVE